MHALPSFILPSEKSAVTRSLGPVAVALTLAMAAVILGIAPAVSAHGKAEAAEQQGHHHALSDEATRSAADYSIPQIKLVRADGKSVWLADEINDGRPVVMDFIYTTCTSICPLSSQTFSELQEKLGRSRDGVHLVSISIDPEQDTPEKLAAYAKKFGAGPEWDHYTGTLAASIVAQKAFNAYRGSKMEHAPVTLIRTAPGKSWVRIEGFATSDQLLRELRQAVASK